MYKVSVEKCNSYNNNEVRKAIETSLKNIDFSFMDNSFSPHTKAQNYPDRKICRKGNESDRIFYKKNLKVLIKPNILSPHSQKKL